MARARMTDMGGDLSSLLQAAKIPSSQPDTAPRTEKTAPARPEKQKTRSTAGNTDPQPSARPTTPEVTATPPTKKPVAVDAGTTADGPRYLTFMRKETRIAQAQADQLSSIARSLNMARKGQGERITDNTLIRVAIGLLLERRDELNGTTEVELFRSLGLTPAD